MTAETGTSGATKNVPWDLEENAILLRRVKEQTDSRGRPRWAHVAKGLPGRTPQESRCRYRRITDAQARRDRGERFRNKCHVCGQSRRGHVCTGVMGKAASIALPAKSDENSAPTLEISTVPIVEVKKEKVVKPPRPTPAKKAEPAEPAEPLCFECVDEEDVLPALPLPIQKTPSKMEFPGGGLDELVAKMHAAWGLPPAPSLKRLPSMSSYIDAYYDEGRQLEGPVEPFVSLSTSFSFSEALECF